MGCGLGADAISPWRLKALLEYNPATGLFTNRVHRGSRARAGAVAGNVVTVGSGDTYWEIVLDGQKYYAHRLAWFWVHGVWPTETVIHKDGITMHNAIANLELATKAECQYRNLKPLPHGSTGRRGVSYDRARNFQLRPYKAKIKFNMEAIHLGRFSDPDEAELVYLVAKAFFHGQNQATDTGE